MNIALTGSSGSIGSILVDDLKSAGHKIFCISSSHSFHEKNIYTYDEIISRKINFEADLIFHLASINSNLDESQIDEELNLCKSVFKVMEVTGCSNLIFLAQLRFMEKTLLKLINLLKIQFWSQKVLMERQKNNVKN